jgi:hypothetical protein
MLATANSPIFHCSPRDVLRTEYLARTVPIQRKIEFQMSKVRDLTQPLCEQIRRIEAGTESGLLFAKIFGSSSGHIANRSAFASLK